jgi:hypothetical protein
MESSLGLISSQDGEKSTFRNKQKSPFHRQIGKETQHLLYSRPFPMNRRRGAIQERGSDHTVYTIIRHIYIINYHDQQP